ncbi:MAG TPA: hypothetical protein VG125_27595 [Pirellulales bacterium]|nr:hypothetical protein [Pirellulales bacterium]
MLYALIPSLVVVLSLGQADESEDKFCLTSQAFGKTYKSYMAHDAIRISPAWDEEAESPPVSPRKAIKLAEKMRKSVVKAPDGWKWEVMNLHLLFEEDQLSGEVHCAWHVMFQAIPIKQKSGPIPFHEVTLIVLMDGTVLEPTVEDAPPEKKPAD